MRGRSGEPQPALFTGSDMQRLEVDKNQFVDADAAYRLLIEAHRGLSDIDSAALNARLVLILANQVGDLDVLRETVRLAKLRQE